jgi:hypothetical protein
MVRNQLAPPSRMMLIQREQHGNTPLGEGPHVDGLEMSRCGSAVSGEFQGDLRLRGWPTPRTSVGRTSVGVLV